MVCFKNNTIGFFYCIDILLYLNQPEIEEKNARSGFWFWRGRGVTNCSHWKVKREILIWHYCFTILFFWKELLEKIFPYRKATVYFFYTSSQCISKKTAVLCVYHRWTSFTLFNKMNHWSPSAFVAPSHHLISPWVSRVRLCVSYPNTAQCADVYKERRKSSALCS